MRRVAAGAPILRRLTRQELENSIGDVFPEIAGDWGGVQLGPDPNSKLGFANDANALLVGDSVAEKIPRHRGGRCAPRH